MGEPPWGEIVVLLGEIPLCLLLRTYLVVLWVRLHMHIYIKMNTIVLNNLRASWGILLRHNPLHHQL
jgi:hypothetical protein